MERPTPLEQLKQLLEYGKFLDRIYPAGPPNDTEQLKQLMDYTKFHIGLYTTLCTILIGILGLEAFKRGAYPLRWYFFATLICFVLAGFFGGLIGANLPHFARFKDFERAKIGPYCLRCLSVNLCIRLEHRPGPGNLHRTIGGVSA